MHAPAWKVQPFHPSDAAPLAAILPKASAAIKHAGQKADGRFWVITHQEQPVGFAALLPLPGLPHLFDLVGGVGLQFQRQGAGSFLWQQVINAVSGTAVHQIIHTVNSLDSPTARFLTKHGFTLEYEEGTMRLADCQTAVLPEAAAPACQLQRVQQQTAGQILPALYERCFAGTPWYQPYTAAEIAASWEPGDQLFFLRENDAPIGFAWLHLPQAGAFEIEPLGIVKEKQGQGYGRFLLTAVLQRLQKQPGQTVSLKVWASNQAAIRLYQSLGFRQVSRRYGLIFTVA